MSELSPSDLILADDDDADPRAPVTDEARARARDGAAAVVDLLEALARDLRLLAEIDEPTRRRLVIAAGAISRPDRYARKALSKRLVRQKNDARRDADQAVLESTGIRALRKAPVFVTPREAVAMPKLPVEALLADAPGPDGAGDDAWAAAEARREEAVEAAAAPAGVDAPPPAAPGARVVEPRHCYVCKVDFHDLHFFYDQMCAECAELNWRKRNQTADLRGRVALVTGARVKIGYQAAIKLLRAGAEVIVVTRFPRDAARRFAAEADASAWLDRCHVYGVDLRHTPSIEALCAHLVATLPRLDALINNACQTVRRPSGFYGHLMEAEHEPFGALPRDVQRPLERWEALRADRLLPDAGGDAGAAGGALAATGAPATGMFRSAMLSQIPLLAEDLERGNHLFPAGKLDADLQQVDLRESNSWRMALADVPTAELLEVQLVNAIAPFVLNARLRPLLARVPTRDAHVVNVSAMEGQFYRRFKTDKHPHTNMAKAALNMMTRTSAIDYVRDGIHMNSVDTGWVTDEDPAEIAKRKVEIHRFSPPLDIVDGAARIVDPWLDGVNTGRNVWGLFLKDYKPTPW